MGERGRGIDRERENLTSATGHVNSRAVDKNQNSYCFQATSLPVTGAA